MIRKQSKIPDIVHNLWDLILTTTAFLAAYFLKKYLLPFPFRGLSDIPDYYTVLLLVIIIWYVTFNLFGLYSFDVRQNLYQMIWDIIKAVATSTLILNICFTLMKMPYVPRVFLVLFIFLDIVLLGVSKITIYLVLSDARKNGFNTRNILVIGDEETANDFVESIKDQIEGRYKILGCLDTDYKKIGCSLKNGTPIIDTINSLEKIIKEKVVDELIFTKPLKEVENAENYILLAEKTGVEVKIPLDWHVRTIGYRPQVGSYQIEDFFGIPTITLASGPNEPGRLFVKIAMDYIVAGVGISLCLPLIIIISVMIKCTSKGPILFKQERVGLNGRRFILFKFRTMVADAEARRKELEVHNETHGPVFKMKKDPRIIPILGTLLRRSSLDELPQLINVVRGEMSLVGPRPPIPPEVERYDIWQRRRLSMKPGMTCIWQVSPNRHEVNFDEWMNMDLKYIDNWSLKLDFILLFKTAWAILKGSGQ